MHCWVPFIPSLYPYHDANFDTNFRNQSETFFESCGVADLITTCFGGRNRKCAEAYAKDPTKVSRSSESCARLRQRMRALARVREMFLRARQGWDAIEKEILNGQKLQVKQMRLPASTHHQQIGHLLNLLLISQHEPMNTQPASQTP